MNESESKIRPNGTKRRFGNFSCECGNIKIYDLSAVKIGHTKECLSCSIKTRSIKKSTHNLSKHPLYRKWQDMKNRCYNKKVDRYSSYGGNGICVCNEWKDSFESFYNWSIQSGWEKGLTIERKNVNGNYEPSNCKYITAKEQVYNKKNSFYVTINNKKYSLLKLLINNNISDKYHTVWVGLSNGKAIDYYVNKLQIKI